MPNPTQEQIADRLAAVIGGAEGQGVVLTDKKFAQADDELVPLLISQSEDGTLAGWVISWDELPRQVDDGSCDVVTTYRFKLAHLFGYLNDELERETSEVTFKRNLFNANEALNASRDLGMDNRVRHNCLQSSEPFDLIDYTHNAENRIAHIALFDLDVEVTNTY